MSDSTGTAVHVASGKVRELYELGTDRLLLVASDRISTFDVVLPTEIPDKGRVLTGLSAFREVERVSLDLYRFASTYAAERGILIADTKFEFGIDPDSKLVLADEAFTPDSSRFWPADEYEPGKPQPSFDKQYVRDYCESLGWDKTAPGPELPDEVVEGTRRRYVDAFERLTGLAFDDYLADPTVALR